MVLVAQQYDFVIGVDTHSKTHTFSIISTHTGGEISSETFPTTTAAMTRALGWVERRSSADTSRVLFSMEGTGSYGAKLCRLATEAGYRVAEAPFPQRRLGRIRGKSDAIDARNAAQGILSVDVDRLRSPRGGEVHTALRVLTVARDSMTRERTSTINALTSLLRMIDLGFELRGALGLKGLRVIAAWRPREENLGTRVSRREASRLAKHALELGELLKENKLELAELVEQTAPGFLELPSVGPVSAGVILTVWSHPGRIRSESAFASLAGTCPIPASSGGTTRYRLNRGGDRQLNKALYTIAIVRMRTHTETKEYVARRTAEGRNKKEIIRSLKHYIGRQIYRELSRSKAIDAPALLRAA